MTKNTPKKPAVTVRAINLPASWLGKSEKRPSVYMAGTAETNRIPRPPAAVDHDLDFWFGSQLVKVLTGSRRLDGTVLLGSERTAEKLADDGAFGDGLGQGFENGIAEDGLKHAEVDECEQRDRLGVLTPNNCQERSVRRLKGIQNDDGGITCGPKVNPDLRPR